MGYIGAGISRFNTADELTVTGDATIDTTTLVVDSTNNNVGIGTASPEDFGGGYTTLEVAGSSTANGGIFKTATSDSAGTGTAGTEMLMYSNNGGGVITVTSSDPLLFQTAGAERMRIESDGSVGIGTSSPAKPLTVVGGDFSTVLLDNSNAAHGTQILFQANGATNSGADIQMSDAGGMKIRTLAVEPLSFHTSASAGSPSERMNIQSDGKVGINCTPDATFKVVSSGANLIIGFNGTQNYFDASENIFRNFSGTERGRFNSAGALLIGKTADSISNNGISAAGSATGGGHLSVTNDGNSCVTLNRKSSDGEIINLRKDGTTVGSIKAGNGDLLIGTGSVNLRFFDATPAVIPRTASDGTSTGAVDLGNISNKFKDGYFSNAVRGNFFAGQADDNTYMGITGGDVITFATGGSERGRWDSSGRLLVGKTSAGIGTAGVEIRQSDDILITKADDTGLFLNRLNSDGTIVEFKRTGNGVGSISVTTSNTAYNTSSDRRLKSNIENAASASDKIDAIQVRQFDWNVDDSHQDYGLIAQELQPIEPLAVTGDANSDEMMAVDYSKLVPMLIKEIQELRSRVAALEAS
jgi:hypothetical protein